jgi:hypothetical protein
VSWLEPILTLVIFCSAVVLLVVLGHYLQRHIFNYRLTDSSVQAVLFGKVAVFRVSYERIEQVRVISFGEALRYVLAVHAGNRLGGPVVLICRRSFPVLLTPDNPEEFARDLQRRVYERTGQRPLTSS